MFIRCVRSKTHGRSVSTSFYEDYLRAARLRQQTNEFKQLYRLRHRIEGKQAELVAHGLRGTRFVGKPKRNLQHLWLAAAVNLKRLFKLDEIHKKNLSGNLLPINEVKMTALSV